jgi:hypothetical protein
MKPLALNFSVALTLSLIVGSQFSSALAQGSLTPSGAPSPSMKTLAQVEPRTGITNLPLTISQGGSYYLTQSFSQAFTTNAISITTSNVALDLCGFTIAQTTANSSAGINIQSSNANTVIRNVQVRNGSIVGFSTGVSCLGGHLCVLEHNVVTEGGTGISCAASGAAPATGNIVRTCIAGDNSAIGVIFSADATNNANAVIDCDSFNNQAGYDLASANNLIIHCRASNNTTNYMINADNDMGTIAEPIQNTSVVSGSKGGSFGIGVTDPFSNLSFP